MDIRLPLGMLFAIVGALLSGFGVATASSQIYRQHSLGINVNLWSGLGMLAFGATLLWLAKRKASTSPAASR
jgi:hypothetical protein